MSVPKTSDSPQIKLFHLISEGMNTRNIDLVAKTLHKDLRRAIYPRSLGIPDYNKEEFLQKLQELFDIWTENPKVTFHSFVESPETLVYHFTAKAQTSVGVEWDVEMVITSSVAPDEDGNLKIKQYDGFVDSKAHIDFFKAVAEAKSRGERPSHVA